MWRLAVGTLATGKPELIGATRGMDQEPALDLSDRTADATKLTEEMHHGAPGTASPVIAN